MPQMELFGRRWHIATDDFPAPALLSAAFHAAWGGVLVAHAAGAPGLEEPGACTGRATVVALAACFLAAAASSLALAWESSKGTIMQVEARRRVPACLYALSGLLAVELGLLVSVSVETYLHAACKREEKAAGDLALIISSWVVVGGSIVGVLISFNIFGGRKIYQIENQGWRDRVLCLGRCLGVQDHLHSAGADGKAIADEMAQVMSIVFSDLDFTPSDLSACLLLLHAEQKMSVVVDDLEAVPREVLAAAAHYAKFAVAVYGTPLYLWQSPWCGICQLCCANQCQPVRMGMEHGNFGGNLLCCNRLLDYQVILETTGLSDAEIIYTNFEVQVADVLPFFVALDKTTNSIVIAVRGTLSFKDVVTDGCLKNVPPEDLAGPQEDPADLRIHRGFFASAKAVLRELEEKGVFEDYINPLVRNPVGTGGATSTTWNLITTGHSLGGAVSSILAWILNNKGYPCRCYAFSPPGCTMSTAVSESTKRFCTTVVYNNEWTPSFNAVQVRKMADELRSIAERARCSKFRILWGAFFARCFCARGRYKRIYRTQLSARDPEGAGSGSEMLAGSARDSQGLDPPVSAGRAAPVPFSGRSLTGPERGHLGAADHEEIFKDMSMPGNIIHVRKLEAKHWKAAAHAAVWRPSESFLREGIRITSSMLGDHVPDRTFHVLGALGAGRERVNDPRR